MANQGLVFILIARGAGNATKIRDALEAVAVAIRIAFASIATGGAATAHECRRANHESEQ